jgi:hypothetical protein
MHYIMCIFKVLWKGLDKKYKVCDVVMEIFIVKKSFGF